VTAAVVLSGRLALVADHLVLALADPDPSAGDDPLFVLSWYSVAYADEAPAGNLAFLRLRGGGPFDELVVTDTPDLDVTLRGRLAPRSWPLADPARPATAGTFTRSPVRDRAMSAVIVTPAASVEVEWRDLAPPIVATGPVGSDPPWDSSTVLLEAGAWTVRVNGAEIAGRAFPNEVWRPWLGRPLSSALVAIAEVFRVASGSGPR
jgi:hypothetical protein